MHEDSMIELEGVSLTLSAAAGPVNILHDCDLTVAAGETVSVVGPSGAGKTSLLMIVSGLERASSGTVRTSGRDITAMGEDELAKFRRANLGIVFQAFHLIPAMTALENVALPLELGGHGDPFVRARECLEMVGLGHRLEHFPAQLSGGEQQRVALARAFAATPGLILADEPTGNLDAETGASVMDLLFDLREEHETTLVMVTHDTRLAGRCDRTLTMENGTVTAR
jgi:putative ABC transport system ATP-binding protein